MRSDLALGAAVVVLAFSTSVSGAAAPAVVALVGGTLVDGTGAAPVKDAVVVISGGKIACAGTRAPCPVPAGAETIDVKGSWVTPGLVDAHVHFCQTGWADGRPDSLDVRARYPYEAVEAGLEERPDRFLRSYTCSGVTAVFDVGGYPWTLKLPQRADAGTAAPHVAATGPLLSTLDFWLNLPNDRQFIYMGDEETTRKGVHFVSVKGADAIKVWYIPAKTRRPEEMAALVMVAGDEAKNHSKPLIVHATGLHEAKVALKAGAKMLVHSVDDLPVDDEFIAMAKKNGTIYCPTLTVVGGYLRMYEAAATHTPPKVDDPNGCVDPVTLAHVAETASLSLDPAVVKEKLDRARARVAAGNHVMAANLKRVLAAGIPIAMGTDAGNPLTLHGPAVYAEMEAMQADGMTPMQVLVASTRNGALAMGAAGKDLGTIAPGKAADLLVVGADPTADIAAMRKVRVIVRAGVVHGVADLAAPR